MNKQDLERTVGNIAWQFADKIVRLGLGYAVSVYIARYLGPGDFGVFSYVTSIVAIMTTLSSLGLDSIVVRNLVLVPELHPRILGTAFALKFISGLLVIPLALAAIVYLRPGSVDVKQLVWILVVGVPFLAFDVIEYWYQALLNTKYVVVARAGVAIVMALIRLSLISLGVGVGYFVMANSLELVLMGGALAMAYLANTRNSRRWGFSLQTLINLLGDSWPLMLSALMISVYSKVDQIIIGYVLGDANVGVYSAAVRIVELTYVFPMILANSFFPVLLRAREVDSQRYKDSLQGFFDLMATVPVIFALIVSFLAEPIVLVLYGAKYLDAVPVLRVYVWCLVFVFLLVATAQYLIAENKTIFAFMRNGFAMIVNGVLNWVLIPRFGVEGGAYAALGGYACSSFLANLFDADMRKILVMELKALMLPMAVRRLCEKF